jgi:hypothetical protein
MPLCKKVSQLGYGVAAMRSRRCADITLFVLDTSLWPAIAYSKYVQSPCAVERAALHQPYE